ncbi:protein MRG1-like isoform X2 [Mangifera indica]|uniref:protein MRG1-like isoform X2 n=1 Tax=Mangifera indica TaxID=29780 RepID=UPI001CFC2CDE|nr:protein MRG1-like isoform X2 [Mangifera indica]
MVTHPAGRRLPPIPVSSPRASESSLIMALASTKPRFKRLSYERKSGDTMFTTLVGIKNAKVDKDDMKNNVVKGKKRKSELGVEKDNISLERLIKIQIPSTLKKQLVDDWEFVTQQDQLVKLPRSPNVDEILTKYIQYRRKKDGLMVDSVAEIMRGIQLYFDKTLHVMLLYRKEREQYHDVVVDNVSLSTIYGAEHLLRLFVKLPELLAYVNIEDETLTRMQQKLTDFLKWLQKNQSSFFLSNYDGSSVSDDNTKGKDD